jgi:hypothetical protein
MGTGSFPGVKSGRGVTLIPHPLLVPWSWKGRAIPLLPLWAVRPIQSLSACTRVHFTVRPAQSLSACTRVHFNVRPVQSLSACTRVDFTVRPIQSLSACTRAHFNLLLATIKFLRSTVFHGFSCSSLGSVTHSDKDHLAGDSYNMLCQWMVSAGQYTTQMITLRKQTYQFTY